MPEVQLDLNRSASVSVEADSLSECAKRRHHHRGMDTLARDEQQDPGGLRSLLARANLRKLAMPPATEPRRPDQVILSDRIDNLAGWISGGPDPQPGTGFLV